MEKTKKEEQLKENRMRFIYRIMDIFYYGGMMHTAEMEYPGHQSLITLNPINRTKIEPVSFCYNYFEDAFWNSIEFDPENLSLHCGKDGGREFSNVLHAAMTLYDLMKPEEWIPHLNEDAESARRSTGWINHLFQEDYRLEDGRSIRPISTVDFLHLDDEIAYLYNPIALQDRRDYTMTEADRLYWWKRGEDDVILSGELNQMLLGLVARYRECMHELEEKPYEESAFRSMFMQQLCDLNEHYKRIYPFHSMVWEFLLNADKVPYQAATRLLNQLDMDSRLEGSVIRLANIDWDSNSCNITRNPGRMRIKRYLAIMANKELRKRFFDF